MLNILIYSMLSYIAPYPIIQCDKDYNQAIMYIEMGASEQLWYNKLKCDNTIEFNRETGCFTLLCY